MRSVRSVRSVRSMRSMRSMRRWRFLSHIFPFWILIFIYIRRKKIEMVDIQYLPKFFLSCRNGTCREGLPDVHRHNNQLLLWVGWSTAGCGGVHLKELDLHTDCHLRSCFPLPVLLLVGRFYRSIKVIILQCDLLLLFLNTFSFHVLEYFSRIFRKSWIILENLQRSLKISSIF